MSILDALFDDIEAGGQQGNVSVIPTTPTAVVEQEVTVQVEDEFTPAGENTEVDLIDVRSRLESIIKEMSHTHKERSGAIRTAWIAALARQHFLMLGPGGTGKSMLARDMATRVTGARYFEHVLNPHSEPDHIAGPANLKRVAEEGVISRVTAGKLPEAHFAFLDEFFNASDSLLHYLQPVLNERVSDHAGDGTPVAIPLRFMLMGTNRIPEELELAPLFDRVHHRVKVGYVQRRNARASVVTDGLARRREGTSGPHTTVTLQELDAAHRAANLLNLSTRAREVMLDIIETLERDGVTVGTRRLVEFAGASAANAWLNGHSEIQVDDLVVGVDMLWSQDAQIKQVQKVVREMTSVVSDSTYLKEMAESLRSVWKEFQGVEPDITNRKDDVIALYRRVEDIAKRVAASDMGSTAAQEVATACMAARAAMTRAAFGVVRRSISRPTR